MNNITLNIEKKPTANSTQTSSTYYFSDFIKKLALLILLLCLPSGILILLPDENILTGKVVSATASSFVLQYDDSTREIKITNETEGSVPEVNDEISVYASSNIFGCNAKEISEVDSPISSVAQARIILNKIIISLVLVVTSFPLLIALCSSLFIGFGGYRY